MKKKSIIPKVLINVMMFGFFVLATRELYLIDKTELTMSIVFNIAIGIVSLLGLSVLCLVHTIDTTPYDVSARLFFSLIVLAYLGVIFDNITWLVVCSEPHKHDVLIKYILDIGSFLVMPIILAVFWNYQNRVFVGESKLSNKIKKAVNFLGIADIIFIIIGSATKYIFYIDASGKYIVADGVTLIFIYPTIVVFCCVAENLRRKLPLKKKLSLLSVGILPAITIVSSMLLPEYSFVYVLRH